MEGAIGFIAMETLFTMAILVSLAQVHKRVSLVLKRQENIIESQRLSTILRLEPASLKISPDKFLADRVAIKCRLMQCLAQDNHPQPDTRAFNILHHSGWRGFVNSDTALKAQNALARLIANNDHEGARAFCEELVDRL